MKKMLFGTLLLGVFLFSCRPEKIEMGEAAKFYPPAPQLLEGVANKFYEHYIPDNTGESPSTDISYHTYQFIRPDTLVIHSYDAAMRLKWNTNYQVSNNQFKTIDVFHSNLFLLETVKAEITNDIMMDWVNNEARSNYKFQLSNGYQMIYSKRQSEAKDTVIENRSFKMIKSNDNYTVVSPTNDSTSYPSTTKRFYAEGIGLYERYSKTEKGMSRSELVEQMSLKDFKKLASHGKKRMAYIDPNHTLDDNSNFKICQKEIQIKDYYNCENQGQIKGGKGTWKRILKKELDPQKLKNESGYLTFRFVINCEGETGRFITEEADLDFQKKKFDKETISHFFEIVAKQKDWVACNARGASYDSYAYVTFKLKDGNVIEILP